MENNRHGGKGTWLAVFGLNCAKQGGGKEIIVALSLETVLRTLKERLKRKTRGPYL